VSLYLAQDLFEQMEGEKFWTNTHGDAGDDDGDDGNSTGDEDGAGKDASGAGPAEDPAAKPKKGGKGGKPAKAAKKRAQPGGCERDCSAGLTCPASCLTISPVLSYHPLSIVFTERSKHTGKQRRVEVEYEREMPQREQETDW
jgi:hypothetical protein